METARDKFFFYNSMVCLLKAIEAKRVRVEIRNGVVIEGTLDSVERTMSMNMSNVTLTPVKGVPMNYSKFYIKGRQIKYVVIPEEVDILRAMHWQLNKTEYFKSKEREERRQIFDQKQQRRLKRAQAMKTAEEKHSRDVFKHKDKADLKQQKGTS